MIAGLGCVSSIKISLFYSEKEIGAPVDQNNGIADVTKGKAYWEKRVKRFDAAQ
tara:strand:- start:8526 stop:8687 length:162 start_codon:yes stop_codon:yes gene_type:complete